MNRELPVLSIIITYNGSAVISKCLNALTRNIDASAIIVIDNGSSDDTVRIIREDYNGVELIRLGHNHGFGVANNIGLRVAVARNADFVFLLNQDVYVEDRTIERLLEIAHRFSDYGVLSAMHLNGKADALDYHFSGYVASTLISDVYLGMLKDVYPCHFINAAAWLISGNCLRQVGGFDPLFFLYGEDNDYLNRVRFHKFKIGVCPWIRIIHDRGTLHALSTYPETKKIYLNILQRLKDINVPFHHSASNVLLGFLGEILSSIFFLQFRKTGILLKVFAVISTRLGKIRSARTECKGSFAFIGHGSGILHLFNEKKW